MKRKTQTARKYLQVTSDKRCVSIIYKKHSKLQYENRSPTDISPKKKTHRGQMSKQKDVQHHQSLGKS